MTCKFRRNYPLVENNNPRFTSPIGTAGKYLIGRYMLIGHPCGIWKSVYRCIYQRHQPYGLNHKIKQHSLMAAIKFRRNCPLVENNNHRFTSPIGTDGKYLIGRYVLIGHPYGIWKSVYRYIYQRDQPYGLKHRIKQHSLMAAIKFRRNCPLVEKDIPPFTSPIGADGKDPNLKYVFIVHPYGI